MKAALSVPGNLLLMGEYAVLEQNGLGLAVAPEIRIQLKTVLSDKLTIRGRMGQTVTEWNEVNGNPLISEVTAECRKRLKAKHLDMPRNLIEIDSSAFFRRDGRKAGLGSSAAVSVGLAAALIHSAGLPPLISALEGMHTALAAHRRMQGGLGSGYDILTSGHGGMGLFTGGGVPAWKRVSIDWLPPLYLYFGSRSVSSGDAVSAYRLWKESRPAEAERFLNRSNELVLNFLNAGSWNRGRDILVEARDLGIEIGKKIDVPAEIDPPGSGLVGKALGAGNEIGLAAAHSEGDPLQIQGLSEIRLAGEGVQWKL